MGIASFSKDVQCMFTLLLGGDMCTISRFHITLCLFFEGGANNKTDTQFH